MARVLAVVVLVGCFAALASGVLFAPRKPVDWFGFNDYLMKNVKATHTEPVNKLKAKITGMKKPMRRAAEIFFAIREANECNENLLSDLVDAEAAGLRYFKSPPIFIDELIQSHLPRALKLCATYVDSTVQRKSRALLSSDEQVANLTRVIRPVRDPAQIWVRSMDPLRLMAGNLRQLSKHDPEATGVPNHPDSFNYAFNKYLRQPCQRFSSVLGNLFEGAEAIAKVQRIGSQFDLNGLTANSRYLAWTNDVCLRILGINAKDLAEMSSYWY